MKTLADNLAGQEGVNHGFFSKQGGVSSGDYQSLNCGLGSKDDPALVAQNRQRVAAELGVEGDRLISPYQVHSATATIVEEPWRQGEKTPKLDALVTNRRGLAIGVLTADCAPVLFYDPQALVIGAAHAGWRGALGGVLDDTVEKMCRLGASAANIVAAVGPAISFKVYEVGQEFKIKFLQQDQDGQAFIAKPPGAAKVHFDLQAYARHRLLAAGLRHVELIDHCTYGLDQRYFSYRRSQDKGAADFGRQISAIVIR